MTRVHSGLNWVLLGKITELYLRCIITLEQLKQISVRMLPRNLYSYYVGAAAEIEAPRRKGSYFVSLNQLSEADLKNRIGASYV